MLKLSKDHTIYEVWCEHTSESVFVSGKPTKAELAQIIKENDWPKKGFDGKPIKLLVEKLQHFYMKVCTCDICTGKGVQ